MIRNTTVETVILLFVSCSLIPFPIVLRSFDTQAPLAYSLLHTFQTTVSEGRVQTPPFRAMFKIMTLYFFQEQWKHLDSTQKEHYWDLMLQTYGKMVSGGEGMAYPVEGLRSS